jgi:hypothetical protein
MPFPTIGQPMPRAADAYATADKWQGWILAAAGQIAAFAEDSPRPLDELRRLYPLLQTGE